MVAVWFWVWNLTLVGVALGADSVTVNLKYEVPLLPSFWVTSLIENESARCGGVVVADRAHALAVRDRRGSRRSTG